MKIDIKNEITTSEEVDIYIVPVFLDKEIHSSFQKPDELDFTAKSGKKFWFYGQKPKRLVYIGLGKSDDLSNNTLRKNIGAVAKLIRDKKYTSLAVAYPDILPISEEIFTEIVVEAIILGSYRFEKYLTNKERKREAINKLLLLIGSHDTVKVEKGVEIGKILGNSTNLTRNLSNTPHRDMNAVMLAKEAETYSKSNGLTVKIIDRVEAEKEEMNLYLSVNNGSKDTVPAQFVVMEYTPEDTIQKTIVFVGKGITFDTGGISLKPGSKMEEMIYDMCGAGAVIGAMQAFGQLKPKGIKIIGITPLTDNSPSGSATKPGDIIKSKNGKTVEIINTDAEGRLILADALTYAERYKPDFVIDLATLTGACVIALGGIYAAAYFNAKVDKKYKKILLGAGVSTGDLLWEMPLDKEYQEQIKSKHADIKNTGGRPAGSITAAMFLSEFSEKYAWSHLDIAGTAWTDKAKGYNLPGSTGFGVRLLIEFVRKITS